MPLTRQPDSPKQFVSYIKTYLSELNLENVSRKAHNEILSNIIRLFKAQRAMKRNHRTVYPA